MRRILFGFLAFDLFALVIINSLGPFSFNVGQSTVWLALPWQSTTIPDVPAEAVNLPSVRVQQPQANPDESFPEPTSVSDLPLTPAPAQLPAPSQVVNHCYDKAKNRSVFTDSSCESLGLASRAVVDGSKMNQSDRFPVSAHAESSEDAPSPRVSRLASSDRELLCLQIKQQKDLWENSRSEQGRKNAAEYRYQYSKNDCHNVLP